LTPRTLVAEADAHRQAELRTFYEPSAYELAWVRGGKPTLQADGMIQVLLTAMFKGLNPEDYDGSWLAEESNRLRLAGPQATDRDPAGFDMMLTASALHYVSDLHLGKANPKALHRGFDVQHEEVDLPAFVRERLAKASDLRRALSEVDPPFPGYRRTEIALQRYLALAGDATVPPLPKPAKPIEPEIRS
jgi:L,D-transpeptidase YcbB